MTRKLQSTGMVLVVVLSAVVGGVAIGGTAVALEGSAGATYPLTPGSDTLGTFVYVVRPGDNVAQNGIKNITLDFGPGASIANISDRDIFISVRGGQRIEISEEPSGITEVKSLNVSKNRAENRLTITLPRPVRPRVGDVGSEVAIKVENFTTPSQPGTYTVQGTFTDPAGRTDGPATVSYTVSSPELSISNQSVSQFTRTQTLNVSASIPGGGYVGIFTVGENGEPGQLIGQTNVSTAPSAQNYTVDVSGNISESQQVVAIAYTESQGRSGGLRAQQSFDPAQDNRLTVNGRVVNATGFVSTLDVDARVTAGGQYDQGAQLYFSRGEPNTAYQIRAIENGELGPAATQFQTAANGTVTLDTAQLGSGQYAITRVADGSLVSLDNDSTTSAQDDSFVITGQQTQTQTTTTGGTTTAAVTDGGTPTDGDAQTETSAPTTGGAQTETAGAPGDGGAANGTAAGGNGGGGSGGSGAFGPGFGVVVAVIALLGAALLATRRR